MKYLTIQTVAWSAWVAVAAAVAAVNAVEAGLRYAPVRQAAQAVYTRGHR